MKIVYTSLLFWAHGMALTPGLVLIHPSRKNDEVLLAHEMKHCEQMTQVGTFVFWLKYFCWRPFRKAVEAAAYGVSYRLAPRKLREFATTLANDYWLGITVDEAEGLIQESLKGE